jgi:hypothetical protein
MVLSPDRFMNEKLNKAGIESETAAAAQKLWGKAEGILIAFARHGKGFTGIDEHDIFEQRMRDFIKQHNFFSSVGKIIGGVAIDSGIPDEQSKMPDYALKSYSVKSFGKEKVKGISVTSSDNFAVFLVKRGKKVDFQAWKGERKIFWDIKMTGNDMGAELKLASSLLGLLREKLYLKK